MKGAAPRNDIAKPQNGIAETGSNYDIGAGIAQKMTYSSSKLVGLFSAKNNLLIGTED